MAQPSDPLRDAARLLEAGRPDSARAVLAPLLAAKAPSAAAVLLHGRALAEGGRPDAAREVLDAGLAAARGDAALWLERALLAPLLGEGDGRAVQRAAKASGLPAPIRTMVAAAASGKGARAAGLGDARRRDMAALDRAAATGDRGAAEAAARAVARSGAAALLALGSARLKAGAAEAAVAAFRRGLAQEPYAADLRVLLARALARAGDAPAALAEARRATRLAPAWPEAQLLFGRLALSHGLADHAARAADAALAAEPRLDAALRLAVDAALADGRAADALGHAEARADGAADRDLLIGRAAAAARRGADARAAYDRGLARDPEDAALRLARAQLLQSEGRADEAARDLEAILARTPGHGGAARALAYGTRLDPAAPVVAAMRAALSATGTGPEDRRLLHYALARVDETSDPASAFDHLDAANAATAARWPHDADRDRQDFARITGPEWDALRAVPGDSACEAAPIFVTGLPRSGTTLVETILAAHPGVRAGGEMAVLGPVLRALATRREDGADALTRFGAAYEARAEAAAGGPDPRRTTDKSIHTYVQIGHALRILPRARVVVVRRDPRDVALSLWRNQFADGTHRYAATAAGIAHHVALFHEAIAFWRGALPEGSFHEIGYEALLDAPEAEARRLLAYCGLDWTDAVLTFHERAERVDTLSFAQVRRPLYRSSVGGWRAHADRIAPLLDALHARGLIPGD